MAHTRFAIYDAPTDDALASFGAIWLGWDVRTGSATRQADVPGLDDITMTPRKYGFHGTLKPPIRLADGHTLDELQARAGDLAGRYEISSIALCGERADGRFELIQRYALTG